MLISKTNLGVIFSAKILDVVANNKLFCSVSYYNMLINDNGYNICEASKGQLEENGRKYYSQMQQFCERCISVYENKDLTWCTNNIKNKGPGVLGGSIMSMMSVNVWGGS